MDGDNNENTRPQGSNIRPPSRLPAISARALYEISEADTNSRSALSNASLPSLAAGSKHKLSGQHEPPSKRKTLAERAGEPVASSGVYHNSRPLNSSIKGTSLPGIRNGSINSNSSSRAVSSRNISTSTFVNSIGQMGKSHSKQMNGKHETGISRIKSIFKAPEVSDRPATSIGHHHDSHNTGQRQAWDHDSRLEKMDDHMKQMLSTFIETTSADKTERQEALNIYKTRIQELETIRAQLTNTNTSLQSEVDDLKRKVFEAGLALDETRRKYSIDLDEQQKRHRTELEYHRDDARRDLEKVKRETEDKVNRLLKAHNEDFSTLEKRMKEELDTEKASKKMDIQKLTEQLAVQRQDAELKSGNKDREAERIKDTLAMTAADLDRERTMNESLKVKLSDVSSNIIVLESSMQAMREKVDFLQSNSQTQTQTFNDMQKRMQDAIDSAAEANSKLRQEETLRRKLHNQVQELKGNIRVFCRVRPCLTGEESEAAKITFPDSDLDSKEVKVLGPEQKSALGNVTTTTNNFVYDRVFGPSSQNSEVFEEISQLVQSALDGYNVCIFCYGQTGSGKTYTMSSEDGMIPLAVHQIYDSATKLGEKGWKYTMEGSFVEVYNEVINDLLGKADDIDKKKHEIRHDNQSCKTTITDVTTIMLESPELVKTMLARAADNRSVAATKANSRSSRSHSVFILKLTGENSITGERSEGTLNLVDLAGSERIAHSGATGDRLKETQNINKSLSCLGDVIGALGQGKDGGHIPYRNSKLTYLLQHSLGGNSKTLMFVMISPMQAHLSETLTSLKFATKVHNTHIGTAKKQVKVRD